MSENVDRDSVASHCSNASAKVYRGDECMNCGLPQTKNPHPDAGKMSHLMEVGAVFGCLPCANKRAWRRRVEWTETIEAIEGCRDQMWIEADEAEWSDETKAVVAQFAAQLDNIANVARAKRF